MRTTTRKTRTAAANGTEKLRMGRLEESIGFLLGRAWRDAQRRFDRYFRELRITAPQFATLILLELNHECTPGELSAALGMGHNNFVVVVDDLVARGLVSRTTCADDRRKRRLALTDAGAELLRQGHEADDRSEAEFTAKFGASHATRLLALLRRIEEP